MIDWASFLIVGLASLVGASTLVATASLGISLLENGTRARQANPRAGRTALVGAWALFALCGILVIFGVYLIVPFFH